MKAMKAPRDYTFFGIYISFHKKHFTGKFLCVPYQRRQAEKAFFTQESTIEGFTLGPAELSKIESFKEKKKADWQRAPVLKLTVGFYEDVEDSAVKRLAKSGHVLKSAINGILLKEHKYSQSKLDRDS